MIARAAGLCGLDTELDERVIRDTLSQFADYRAAGWAAGPLAFCYAEGILDDAALTIEPAERVTRAELGGMIYRMLRRAGLL
jgi:hypothetical protein